MVTRVRAWGSCALSGLLAFALAVGLSGYPAQAEEPASPKTYRESAFEDAALLPDDRAVETPAGPETPSDEVGCDTDSAEEVSIADEGSSTDAVEANGAAEASNPENEASGGGGSPHNDSPVLLVEPEAVDPAVSLEGSTLYANGVAVCIKKDADGKTYVFNEDGTEKLVTDPVSLSAVYGGSKNAPVDGDASIRIEGVAIGTVYGGGYSDGSGSADVSGNATVTIVGKANAGSVHGGGKAAATKGNASANVSGAASVAVTAQLTTNHNNLNGGGEASTQKEFSASATTGSTSVTVVGRTYSARGGGSASSVDEATGLATADVEGAIEMSLDGIDVREVYGGGSASGKSAHATASSVSIEIDGDEAMWVQGGGTASSGGTADVSGPTRIDIANCSNLYGYIFGGGRASEGSSACVGSAAVSVRDSAYPVDTQFGEYVAGATFAGGYATGAQARADVAGSASLELSNCEGGGNVYGSGDASGGGSACVGNSRASLAAVSDTAFDGKTFACLVHAGGETDNPETSRVSPSSIAVTVEGSAVERLAGGSLVGEEAVPTACESRLAVVGDQNRIQELACFDAVALASPLSLERFTANGADAPTVLSVTGIGKGERVIVCKDASVSPTAFSRVGGALDFALEDVDGDRAAVWRMGVPAAAVEVIVPTEPDAPAVSVDNMDELAQKLVSEEDRAAMEAGSSVAFSVRVEPLEELPESVAPTVEKALAEQQHVLAYHLDINLVKSVDGNETAVHSIEETGSRMLFCVEVPAELADEKRTFSVMRFHETPNGSIEATELSDIDDEPSTVTFETDRFSVYSLVYREDAAGEPGDHGTPGGDGQGSEPENPGGETPGSGGDEGDGGGQPDENGGNPNGTTDIPGPHRIVASTLPSTGDAFGSLVLLGFGAAALLLVCFGALRLRMRSVRMSR